MEVAIEINRSAYDHKITETSIRQAIMNPVYDEEAQALADEFAKNPPKVKGDGKSGFFMKHKGNIIILNDVEATWLRVTSESAHKTPSDYSSEMIRERMAM